MRPSTDCREATADNSEYDWTPDEARLLITVLCLLLGNCMLATSESGEDTSEAWQHGHHRLQVCRDTIVTTEAELNETGSKLKASRS